MGHQLAFPMYAVNHADADALRRAVQHLLAARGLAVNDAPGVPETALLAHWQQPDLLLSQTCGYPLVTQLPDVQVVGCFHYAAPGCEGIHYRSVLVTREADKHLTLADFRARRAVCNSPDSQSGYNALRRLLAPVELRDYFAQVTFSGSHRQSLVNITRGEADIAAIDCVTWALLQRHEPTLARGLTVIDRTPLTPGLPLITARETPPEALRTIREALSALVTAPEYRAVCEASLIRGFSAVTRQAYAGLLA
ncbi:phosphate/phosphite/phosphonate ABC transporter substrate-binding protein [Enterobacter soli]|uniref:phosphate/phosphite/phosphonate ABC transporter substrate-binding protein n=1 Tax=Enterobacter soli TaxID=885040 RepID=UPI0034CD2376